MLRIWAFFRSLLGLVAAHSATESTTINAGLIRSLLGLRVQIAKVHALNVDLVGEGMEA